jgi:hypothetical protein
MNKESAGDNEHSLMSFIADKDNEYMLKVDELALFQESEAKKLKTLAKQRLVAIFFHIRGHFYEFLWYMLCFAPNKEAKDIILANIAEESGGDRLSHEQLFDCFARQFSVDLNVEWIEQTHYLPFVKAFNQGHLIWLRKHDWASRFSAFSAYERLDNIDYPRLRQLAKNIGCDRQGLIFFDVHVKVAHFEPTLEMVEEIWQQEPLKVKKAFDFIYQSQLKVWQALSDDILKFNASL